MNSLDVINSLNQLEYGQPQELVDDYTLDTSQYHQCGFIAKSVQRNVDLTYAVVEAIVKKATTDTN